MIFYGPLMKNYQVSSVYIGGGTPSYIDEQWIAALMEGVFDCFNVLPDAEISIECNPVRLAGKAFSIQGCGNQPPVHRTAVGK